jgi:hypothetical protein
VIYDYSGFIFKTNVFAVLDPAKKLSYFRKHWPVDLQEEAVQNMEETASALN